MAEVLKVEEAPRGLPLLVERLAGNEDSKPAGSLLVAAESLLRAFLLLAELGVEDSSGFEQSLGRKLGRKYSQAHLLLTADTLFTWPLELVAGELDPEGGSLSAALATAFGPRGSLAELEKASPDLKGLLGLDPVRALAEAASGSLVERGEVAHLAAKWIYLRELAGWLGFPRQVEEAAKNIEEKLTCAAGELSGELDRNLVDLVEFLSVSLPGSRGSA